MTTRPKDIAEPAAEASADPQKYVIPKDIQELFEIEAALDAKPPDPEEHLRNAVKAATFYAINMRLGGYSRPVKTSPHVEAILRLQQRRMAGLE